MELLVSQTELGAELELGVLLTLGWTEGASVVGGDVVKLGAELSPPVGLEVGLSVAGA